MTRLPILRLPGNGLVKAGCMFFTVNSGIIRSFAVNLVNENIPGSDTGDHRARTHKKRNGYCFRQ